MICHFVRWGPDLSHVPLVSSRGRQFLSHLQHFRHLPWLYIQITVGRLLPENTCADCTLDCPISALIRYSDRAPGPTCPPMRRRYRSFNIYVLFHHISTLWDRQDWSERCPEGSERGHFLKVFPVFMRFVMNDGERSPLTCEILLIRAL
jgi:hypothetical protein